MPYSSKSQMRAFFAKESRKELPKGTARRWAHHTPSIKALPERVSSKKKKPKRSKQPKRKTAESTITRAQLRELLVGEVCPLSQSVAPSGSQKAASLTAANSVLAGFPDLPTLQTAVPGEQHRQNRVPPEKSAQVVDYARVKFNQRLQEHLEKVARSRQNTVVPRASQKSTSKNRQKDAAQNAVAVKYGNVAQNAVAAIHSDAAQNAVATRRSDAATRNGNAAAQSVSTQSPRTRAVAKLAAFPKFPKLQRLLRGIASPSALTQTMVGGGAGAALGAAEIGSGATDPNMSPEGKAGVIGTNALMGGLVGNPYARTRLFTKRTINNSSAGPGLAPPRAQTTSLRPGRVLGAAAVTAGIPKYVNLTDATAKFSRKAQTMLADPEKSKIITDPTGTARTMATDLARSSVDRAVDKGLNSEGAKLFMTELGKNLGMNVAGSVGGSVVGGLGANALGKLLSGDDERLTYSQRRFREKIRSLLSLVGTVGGGAAGLYAATRFAGTGKTAAVLPTAGAQMPIAGSVPPPAQLPAQSPAPAAQQILQRLAPAPTAAPAGSGSKVLGVLPAGGPGPSQGALPGNSALRSTIQTKGPISASGDFGNPNSGIDIKTAAARYPLLSRLLSVG